MAGLGGAFQSGGVGQQLFVWGLLSQLVQALTNPAITEVSHLVNAQVPNQALSPADVATMVNRGFMDHAAATAEAALSGVDESRLTRLTEIAGLAPGPSELVEALRRGIIAEHEATGDLPSFIDGIRQGNLRDVWADMYRQLAVQLPTWNDALDAKLKGMLPDAEALAWYTKAGGDPDAYTWLYNTRGASPTPDMLGTLANRGIIPWDGYGPDLTTFQQGFHEGFWRNKWQTPMRRLQEYHPPPRTVTALLRAQAITEAQALRYFQEEGMSAELAAAYVKDAASHKTTAAKQLSRGDIETMLVEHLITPEQATGMLTKLGYDAADAKLITSSADVKRALANINNAVTRIRTLYIGRRLDAPGAKDALHKLGLAPDSITAMIETWDIAQHATVKLLTEAQVVDAWNLQILTQEQAITELQAMGYHPYDAWVLLSIKNKAPLPNPPAGAITP